MDYREAKQKAIEELEKRTGRDYASLVPWQDYDPIMIDNRAYELMRLGIRWTGD